MSDDDFTKLYRSITKSTVWVGQPPHVKLAWVVMLAEADAMGRVTTPIPALAKLAEITIEQFEEALEIFMAPDKYSRSPELEGRRVVRLDEADEYSGFRLVTHAKHRAKRDPETRRQQNYEAQQRYRERNQGVSRVSQSRSSDLETGKDGSVSQAEDQHSSSDEPGTCDRVSQTVSHVSPIKPIPSASASASASETHSPEPDPPDRSELAQRAESYLRDGYGGHHDFGPPESWPEVVNVLADWRAVWGRGIRIRGGVKDPRLRVILERFVDGYEPAELARAIRGAHADPFTVGSRNAGRLESVLKDAARVDKFIEYFEEPEAKRGGRASSRVQVED